MPGVTDNPWLRIPAADYEAHMDAPEVGQHAVLNRLFRVIYREQQPDTMAVLGCGTGNGFEHINSLLTEYLHGYDINPEYLEIAKQRHKQRLPGLELICEDLNKTAELIPDFYELIYAALVFEYVDVGALLKLISASLVSYGVLAVVLQLESAEKAAVTPSVYGSIKQLEPLMRLVPPAEFLAHADEAGLYPVREWEMPLQSGKRFWAALLAQ